mgnify:CR=1 FL=1
MIDPAVRRVETVLRNPVVIFGATGDLTRRKLVPALFSLAQEGQLPADFNIIGFARRPWSHDDFRQQAGSFDVTLQAAERFRAQGRGGQGQGRGRAGAGEGPRRGHRRGVKARQNT